MKIPKKQSDILLSTYLEYQDYVKELKEDYDHKELILKTIEIFYKIDNADEIPYIQLMDMYQIIDNILNTPQNIISTFTMSGIEYGLNPNFDDMTLAEMVDCDTPDVIQQMCVLYRPIVKKHNSKYIIKKYEADISTYNQFKSTLTLDIYNGFISFFLRIQKSFIANIQSYLREEATVPEMKKTLEKNGLGSALSTNFQEVI